MSIITRIKDKLGVKHEIGVKWDNVSGKPSTFAPSTHNHNASDINAGTLPIARGGTGATTRIGAEYNLLSGVESMDATLEDARLFPIKNDTVSASNGVFRWYSLSRLWSYFRTKLGISSAVGGSANPVYVDSNGRLKAVGGTMLKQGSLIDTHSEGSRTILIDGTNELFAFYDRGGTCTAYEYDLEWNSSSPAPAGTFSPADLSSHKTTASVASFSANVFNSLTGYNQSTVYSGTKYAVYDLKLPVSYSHGTTFYWSFGPYWKPNYFEVLVWKNNATQYPNGYISKYRSTNVGAYGSVAVGVGATEGNSFTHMRIVMDKYSRLAALGIVNYSSTGLATNYMSRTVDRSLYRNITVAKNNTYDLGSSSAKWANVYATNFNGALKGNADTASAAKSGSALETAINGKQDKLTAQTAYSAKGSATKVPEITTNALGQVTNITEVDIEQPTIVQDLRVAYDDPTDVARAQSVVPSQYAVGYYTIEEIKKLDDKKLDVSDAADTYLTKADAGTSYLTRRYASDYYLTKEDAADTYLKQTDPSAGVTDWGDSEYKVLCGYKGGSITEVAPGLNHGAPKSSGSEYLISVFHNETAKISYYKDVLAEKVTVGKALADGDGNNIRSTYATMLPRNISAAGIANIGYLSPSILCVRDGVAITSTTISGIVTACVSSEYRKKDGYSYKILNVSANTVTITGFAQSKTWSLPAKTFMTAVCWGGEYYREDT